MEKGLYKIHKRKPSFSFVGFTYHRMFATLLCFLFIGNCYYIQSIAFVHNTFLPSKMANNYNVKVSEINQLRVEQDRMKLVQMNRVEASALQLELDKVTLFSEGKGNVDEGGNGVSLPPDSFLQGIYVDPLYNAFVLPQPVRHYIPDDQCLNAPPRNISELQQDKKYFIEVGWNPQLQKHTIRDGSHYDTRFFSRKMDRDSRIQHHIHLMEVWGRFADLHQLPYWVAHGSLLGWYWGKKIMPWDQDIDLLTEKDVLRWIDCHFPRDEYGLVVIDDKVSLDINPHYILGGVLKSNTIDARLIDTQTGLFIDFTTLSNGPWDDPDILYHHNKPSQNLTVGEWWSCKSPHFVREEYIYPLVRTVFEGIRTWRPNNFVACLSSEYTEAAIKKEVMWRMYQWNGLNDKDSEKFGREGKWELISYRGKKYWGV